MSLSVSGCLSCALLYLAVGISLCLTLYFQITRVCASLYLLFLFVLLLWLCVCVSCGQSVHLLAISDPSLSVLSPSLSSSSACYSRWTCFHIKLLMRQRCSFCGSLNGGPTI